MRTALASSFLVPDDPARAAPERFVDRLRRAGAGGVALSSHLPPGLCEALCEALRPRREELPVLSIESVCPDRAARAADLCALDRAEAQVALEAATETVRLAGRLGCPHVALRLGEARALAAGWPRARLHLLRGQLDDEPRLRERLVRGRLAAGAPHLDVALRALDRLARVAEGEGVVLGLRSPARPHALPSLEELPVLLAQLAGAPVAPCLDLAAAHLVDAIGTQPLGAAIEAYAGGPCAYVSDACGAVWGLPPGHGELDLPAALARLPADATLVYRLAPSLDEAELDAAIAAALSLRPSPSPPRSP